MHAMQVMSALSQSTRLEVWRLLVQAAPDGMPAGDIARAVGISKNGMSPHFAILTAAGLVSSTKVGRSVIYRAEMKAVSDLREFLASLCEHGKTTEP